MTLNVQMSLRPKLCALDVLIREYQYPLILHVQEASPLIVQRVHPPSRPQREWLGDAPPSSTGPRT